MRSENQDLTVGSVAPKLIKFGMPVLFANLLQSLYSIVDMLIVGRNVGSSALVALSNASTITFIITSLCTGFAMGGTILVGQYKGAKDEKGQYETVSTMFMISAVVAVVITIIGLIINKWVFTLLNIPAVSLDDACSYMRIIYCGTIFVFGYNSVCSVLRGTGDSKGPLIYVGIATIINVILDIIFVKYCALGVVGAAYATVIAQGVSFIIATIQLRKSGFIFDFKLSGFRVNVDKLKGILSIGGPSAVQMTVVNIAYLAINGMLNKYGVAVAAGYGIGIKINTFAGMPCWAIGQAVSAMVAQNMGARKIDRVSETVRTGIKLSIFVTIIAILIVQIFAGQLVSIFDTNSEVIKEGIKYLRICCLLNSVIYGIMYTFDSFIVGVGNANLAMINALLDAVIVRIILSLVLELTLKSYIGIYIAIAASPIIPAIIGTIYFSRKRWIEKKIIS